MKVEQGGEFLAIFVTAATNEHSDESLSDITQQEKQAIFKTGKRWNKIEIAHPFFKKMLIATARYYVTHEFESSQDTNEIYTNPIVFTQLLLNQEYSSVA